MGTVRVDRTTQMDKILAQLTALKGVTSSALIDPDGLVIHARKDFDIDIEALAPSVQIAFGAATRVSAQSDGGQTRLLLAENQAGLNVMAPLSNNFMLAVIADTDAMLGAVRYEVKEAVTALNKLF